MTRRYGQKEKEQEKRENATETQAGNDTEIRSETERKEKTENATETQAANDTEIRSERERKQKECDGDANSK